MNDKIRALQKSVTEMHAEASGLLSKAAPTGDEVKKGNDLIEKIKAAQVEIETEYMAERGRSSLKGIQAALANPDGAFAFSGKAGGSRFDHIGFSEAGKAVIDSFGTVIDDVGAGSFASEAQYKHISTPEYKRAFVAMIRCKGIEGMGRRGSELKTIQEGLDDQGGAFVPADFIAKIVARKPTPTRVAGMCTNLTTGRDRIVMPRQAYSADDLYTTAFRATWTGEVPASDTASAVTDTGLTGNIEIPVFTAMLTAAVTNDMVEDTAFPIMQWIEDQLRITVDLLKDNMAINGSGNGQPRGMLNNPGGTGQAPVLTTAASQVIAADDVQDMSSAIPEQYDENVTYLFNKTNTYRALRKLKDANGRYLFGMGYQDSGLSVGRPKELAGYPFTWSGFMPDAQTTAGTALTNSGTTIPAIASATPIICGDLLGHYIVNRLGITLQVLRETAAKRNQIEIVCRVRFGGKTVEPWRLRVMQVHA